MESQGHDIGLDWTYSAQVHQVHHSVIQVGGLDHFGEAADASLTQPVEVLFTLVRASSGVNLTNMND